VSNVICESPCFDGWFEPAAAAKRMGSRLMAPPAAETARTVRRLGDEEFVGMSILLGQSQTGYCVGKKTPSFVASTHPISARPDAALLDSDEVAR
jgi:hypothetical protein